MKARHHMLLAVVLVLPGGLAASEGPITDGPTLAAENVRATEAAFAATMATRDFEAFKTFLANDAVFITANGADHGRSAVATTWARYFEGETAPFSWSPERVEVLSAGDLALSTGPVFDASGARTATFTSIWRLEADGQWRIVFDKGERYCAPPPATSAPGQ